MGNICFDCSWDGYTIDKVKNGTLINNVAIGNCRHGYNLVTGSSYIQLIGNTALNSGYCYKTPGNGIMVQSDDEYTTKNILLRNNIINDTKAYGISLVQSKNVTAENNSIVSSGYCISVQETDDVRLGENSCMSGAPKLKLNGSNNGLNTTGAFRNDANNQKVLNVIIGFVTIVAGAVSMAL